MASRGYILLLDISFCTNLAKAIVESKKGRSNHLSVFKAELFERVKSRRLEKVIIPVAKEKSEAKQLERKYRVDDEEKTVRELVVEFLRSTILRATPAQAAHRFELMESGEFEDVMRKLCRDRRNEVRSICVRWGIELKNDPCEHVERVIRRLVKDDVHFPLFILYYTALCFNALLATCDRELKKRFESIRDELRDKHDVDIVYVPRVEGN